MKKIVFSLLAFFVCGLAAFSQQKIYLYLSNGQIIAKNISEIDSISFVEPVIPDVVGEPVDMGLSVQWSNLNYGASAPEDAGELIGWGDVSGSLQDKDLSLYPLLHPVWNITKSQYDIVYAKWGELWRMPTIGEIRELCENCDWEVIDEGDKIGFEVTSRVNSASIFFPLTGIRDGSDIVEQSAGAYWSGSLSSMDDTKAQALYLTAAGANIINDSIGQFRYLGLAIRPVYGELHDGVKIKTGEALSVSSTSAKLPVYLYGALSDVSETGIAYSTDKSSVSTDGENVLSVTDGFEAGSYTFDLSGLLPDTPYYYMAYAKYDGNILVGDTLSFTTENKFPIPAGAIDLGLSVKWAPWNMGASSEADHGALMAWGDPTGESESYDPDDFKCEGLKSISATQYDVAHVQWGDKWRLPSTKEIEELSTLEDWTYYSNYKESGVSGWVVRGGNDSIFIPRAGYEDQNGVKERNMSAYYWTSKYVENKADSATCYMLASKTTIQKEKEKILRMSVRPVYGDVNKNDDLDPNDPIDVDGHEAVTLGSKIRWATCNVGEDNSGVQGDFYAWAETSPKETYSRDVYSYYNDGAYDQLPDTITGAGYDAATAAWGNNWRMPTREELDYLCYYCDAEWTTVDGTYGCKFTSQSNGNSIFLPAAGYMNGTTLKEASTLYYWSSSSYDKRSPNEGLTYYLDGSASGIKTSFEYRYKGMLVRPVTDVTTAQ